MLRTVSSLLPAIMAITAGNLNAGDAIAPLTFYSERYAVTDLEVTGLIKDLPDGESRFIRHADLLKLPTKVMAVEIEFFPGEKKDSTILFLSDLKAALPLKDQTDTLVFHCKDGYYSFFTKDLIAEYKPFVILQIEGKSPQDWPLAPSGADMGPYIATASTDIAPHFKELFYYGSKMPWGAVSVEAVRYNEEFHAIYTGRFAELGEVGDRGRYIYMNNCMNCHHWEDSSFGGVLGERDFRVLAAHARFNVDYFKRYVTKSSEVFAASRMPANPHLTPEDKEALVAFMSAYFPQ